MKKYVVLWYLKRHKDLAKKSRWVRKGLLKVFNGMIRSYKNLEFYQINKTLIDRTYLALLMFVFVFQFAFPRYSGQAYDLYETTKDSLVGLSQSLFINSLPEAENKDYRTIYVTATAYSSMPNQTDSTPCITANGYDLCYHGEENVIAANFLPFGTRVRFPEVDPEKVYTVQDRMHARFPYRVDLWMNETSIAKQFGKKNLRMDIFEN